METKGIGKNIYELRRAAGLTQKQLGEVLSVAPRTVSDWEKDNTEPSVASIRKMVSYFKITFDELFEI